MKTRRMSFTLQMFLSVLLAALGGVLSVGILSRVAHERGFHSFLTSLPVPPAGADASAAPSRQMLITAARTFEAGVDRTVFVGGVGAVLVAAIVALLLARYLNRPLNKLESAAKRVASGDLAYRVALTGPAEVAHLGQAFNRMADSLERAEELRRRMAADVSHELRNPLAAARAQAEGMAEGVLVADRARLDSLADDLKHLSALVEDLHEFAIADAGHLRYEFAPMDLGELAQIEARRAQAYAPEDVGITSEVDGPFKVTGDTLRLSQVVRNLLSNALRHTTSGSIVVSVKPRGDGLVELRVRDTGEGIPDEDLPYVFERFYRADATRSASTGGAGLGLAIARRIVNDHSGTTFAENNPEGGAVVGFRLPFAG